MALARAVTHLLGGGLPPAAASSVLSLRSRLLCGRPADDEPSAPGGAEAERWEAEILRDVQPVVELVKDILHSGRYGDGGFLSPDDEKVVVESFLLTTPVRKTRLVVDLMLLWLTSTLSSRSRDASLFVRTNGDWEDFSYRKCLQAYIEETYPPHAR